MPGEIHDEFGGYHRDLPHLLDRRRALQLIGGVALAGVAASCSSGSDDSADAGSTSPTSATEGGPSTVGDGSAIPEETAGPFPADGSNGPNILGESDIVRTDLTTSFGDLDGTADGVPMSVHLTVVDASSGEARPGAALYLWHCTADGHYSIYEIEDQNYLRGLQVADEAGSVGFDTIFPGCYEGRWPHFHFEVYDDADSAASGSGLAKTSQFALPENECKVVYAEESYGASGSNLSQLSLESDMVFADGWSDQLATVAGSVSDGYTASLLVRV